MNSMRWLTTSALAAGMLILHPMTAGAQTATDLFRQDATHEIRLFINSRDLQQLRTRYQESTYYVADLQWRGIRVRNAAVRVRGRYTRSATKPGLRVDFDRYVTNQRFLGMRSLILDNALQDPSYLREALSMAFFERMGQPATRESFCRLYINNVDHGLYVIVEAIEPEFLARTLNENAGYLFEYHVPDQPYYGEDLGDDLAAYKPLFEPRTHKLEADAILYSPIRDLFRELNQPIDAVWRERVERYVDLQAYVTHIAIDRFLSEDDGVMGYSGMNNFYLYRPAGSTIHRFITWDKDLAMTEDEFPIFAGTDAYALSRGALAFPDLRALYLDVLKECARLSLEDDWFSNQVARLSALVRPAARADRLKSFSNDDFESTVGDLARFAANRARAVLEDVASNERRSPQQ